MSLPESHIRKLEQEARFEELRRSQEELETSRNKYAFLYDFAPVGYFTFDPDGLIRSVNLAGEGMLGALQDRAGRPRFRVVCRHGRPTAVQRLPAGGVRRSRQGNLPAAADRQHARAGIGADRGDGLRGGRRMPGGAGRYHRKAAGRTGPGGERVQPGQGPGHDPRRLLELRPGQRRGEGFRRAAADPAPWPRTRPPRRILPRWFTRKTATR